MSFEERRADWLGYHEALDRILSQAVVVPAESVSLAQARGRALAEDVTSPVTLPPWDNSAMDGYAVVGADLTDASDQAPVRLRVIGEVRAGRAEQFTVRSGLAVRIMTGAPVPSGADTVVRVEDTSTDGDYVLVRDSRDRARHIRPGGADLRQGALALGAGSSIGAGAVAVLASVGRDSVRVGGRPSVAIVSSGDELVRPDQIDQVVRGLGIVDSNGPMLEIQAAEAGARTLRTEVAADTVESVRDRLTEAQTCDVIVTAGGASMGAGDLFKRVLDTLDYHLDFWRIRIRPGSPVSFGHLSVGGRRVPVFGLPGNPASAFVTFEVFVRPFLRRLAGHGHVHRPVIQAIAGEPMVAAEHLTVFLRVELSGEPDSRPVARVTGSQASGLVSGLPRADGLLVHPEGVSSIEPGSDCQVIPLHLDWS